MRNQIYCWQLCSHFNFVFGTLFGQHSLVQGEGLSCPDSAHLADCWIVLDKHFRDNFCKWFDAVCIDLRLAENKAGSCRRHHELSAVQEVRRI